MIYKVLCVLLLSVFFTSVCAGDNVSKIVYPGADGKLVYQPYSETGDIVPDFSLVGYMGGSAKIPDVPVKITLEPSGTEQSDLARIQKEIDNLSQMPIDQNGFRGAILLKKGKYYVENTLKISESGIVIRGEGYKDTDTVIVANGKTAYTVINISGANNYTLLEETRTKISDDYVYVGSKTFHVKDASKYSIGDRIVAHKTVNEDWLTFTGMNNIKLKKDPVTQWTTKDYSLKFERMITNIENDQITVDAPFVDALNAKFGGGDMVKINTEGRISNCGVENLRVISTYDESLGVNDKKHAWIAVNTSKIENGWVRNVDVINIGYAAVNISGKNITVDTVSCIDPISPIVGGNRYSFHVGGSQNLVENCYTRNGRHDYVMNSRVAGPNVFYNSVSDKAHADTEPHQRWATGTLYDNIKMINTTKGRIQTLNRGNSGTGHGWAGANMMFWNCTAPLIVVMKPPTAQNFAIGYVPDETQTYDYQKDYDNAKSFVKSITDMELPAFDGTAFSGSTGYTEFPNVQVSPLSLYKQQLEDRISVAKGKVKDTILLYHNGNGVYMNEALQKMPQMNRLINDKTYVSLYFATDILGAKLTKKADNTVKVDYKGKSVTLPLKDSDYIPFRELMNGLSLKFTWQKGGLIAIGDVEFDKGDGVIIKDLLNILEFNSY